MASQREKLTVRMPSPLKAQIEEAAAASGRSVNAEILHRLRVSFDAWKLDRVRP
jgi:predicted HicB family RNase H-like nuclease